MRRPPAATDNDIRGVQPAGLPVARVWDLPLRIFHWSLVVAVAFMLVSGWLLPPVFVNFHVWVGSAIAVLIVGRLIWGFLGTRTSRFSNFPPSLSRGIGELRERLAGHPAEPCSGHNPAGALMVYALLATLMVLVVSGFMAWGGKEKSGPLAAFLSFDVGSLANQLHSLVGFLLAGLIAAHLIGVIVASRAERQNLVHVMVTGRKRVAKLVEPATARPLLATVILAGFIVAGSALWLRGAALPALGAAVAAVPATYNSACGECHMAFPPQLLPRASWQKVLASLADHFGEDASIPAADAAAVIAYLDGHASEGSDLKAAHYFGVADATEPRRITAMDHWHRIPDDLPAAAFKAKAVGSKANCAACHHDAESGRFTRAEIAVPE